MSIDLTTLADRLEEAVERATADLERAGYDPLAARDTTGRYLLVDALVALAMVRAAIARQ